MTGLSELDECANAFAMELLLPRKEFGRASEGIDLNDDEALRRLATKFMVPVGVATKRIVDLRTNRLVAPEAMMTHRKARKDKQ